MNNLELKVTNGTDKEIRFEVHIDGSPTGELMMGRENFTKFTDSLFGTNYTVSGNTRTLE